MSLVLAESIVRDAGPSPAEEAEVQDCCSAAWSMTWAQSSDAAWWTTRAWSSETAPSSLRASSISTSAQAAALATSLAMG